MDEEENMYESIAREYVAMLVVSEQTRDEYVQKAMKEVSEAVALLDITLKVREATRGKETIEIHHSGHFLPAIEDYRFMRDMIVQVRNQLERKDLVI
jgi:hypothetical protein